MTQPATDPNAPAPTDPNAPPPAAPTLEDLAKAVETAEASFNAAKATADASSTQAASDQAAEHAAHIALQSAINDLVTAAQNADPAPGLP